MNNEFTNQHIVMFICLGISIFFIRNVSTDHRYFLTRKLTMPPSASETQHLRELTLIGFTVGEDSRQSHTKSAEGLFSLL